MANLTVRLLWRTRKANSLSRYEPHHLDAHGGSHPCATYQDTCGTHPGEDVGGQTSCGRARRHGFQPTQLQALDATFQPLFSCHSSPMQPLIWNFRREDEGPLTVVTIPSLECVQRRLIARDAEAEALHLGSVAQFHLQSRHHIRELSQKCAHPLFDVGD